MPFASPPSPNETAYPDRRSPTQHFDEPSRSLLRSGCAREALGRQRHFRSLCRARVSRSRHMPLRCSMECRSARASDETLAPTRSAHHPARKVCGERRTSRMNIPETQSLPRSHSARASLTFPPITTWRSPSRRSPTHTTTSIPGMPRAGRPRRTMGPRLSRTSDAPRKQRKEANITRASSIAACKAAGLTVFAKREERFGFSQANADEISDQIPDPLKHAGPLCV